MNGDIQVWDPLRKKHVTLTPEERVRQWFITVLRDVMKVPMHMMMSEVGMKYGESTVKKEFRADIVVFDRRPGPMMIVECKRPDVEITKEVMEQALRYDMVMDVRFLALTNGHKTVICKKEHGHVTFLDKPPVYMEMLECGTEVSPGKND